MKVKRQERTPPWHDCTGQGYYNKPAAINQAESINGAMRFIEMALQFTEKQFEAFCSRMQNELKNDTDHATVLQILCSLDAIRNMKGAYTNE